MSKLIFITWIYSFQNILVMFNCICSKKKEIKTSHITKSYIDFEINESFLTINKCISLDAFIPFLEFFSIQFIQIKDREIILTENSAIFQNCIERFY